MTPTICIECGGLKICQAKRMCNTCYKKVGVPRIICSECGQEKAHAAKGLCGNCYQRIAAKRLMICETCKLEKQHYAKGLCESCARKIYSKRSYNPARARKQRRALRERMHDVVLMWQQRYREANRDKLRVASRVYGAQEYVRVSHRRWNLEHAVQVRASKRKWARNHSESIRVNVERRRSRLAGLPATLTAEQWLAIQVAYRHRCAYCGKRSRHLTQDHVISVTRGGWYVCDNIVPACQPCNSSKGNRPPKIIPAVRLML